MADGRYGWIAFGCFRKEAECASLGYLCSLGCDFILDYECVSVESHEIVMRSSALELSNASGSGVFVVFAEV